MMKKPYSQFNIFYEVPLLIREKTGGIRQRINGGVNREEYNPHNIYYDILYTEIAMDHQERLHAFTQSKEKFRMVFDYDDFPPLLNNEVSLDNWLLLHGTHINNPELVKIILNKDNFIISIIDCFSEIGNVKYTAYEYNHKLKKFSSPKTITMREIL